MPAPDESEMGRVFADVTIQYSIRELLARTDDRLIRLDEKMSQLASRAEVEKLAEQVSRHEARWNRMIGASVALGALAGGAAGWVTQVLGAHP